MLLSPVPTLRRKKGTEKLDPISCAHTEAKEWAQAELVRSTVALRYEPCPQFINVSQRELHIYWQFSAMSHAIHKIVSKTRCQSYFISRHKQRQRLVRKRPSLSSLCLCAAHCSRKLSSYKTTKVIQKHVTTLHSVVKMHKNNVTDLMTIYKLPINYRKSLATDS